MENPSQVAYAMEEIFTLKPQIAKNKIVNPKTSHKTTISTFGSNNEAITTIKSTKKANRGLVAVGIIIFICFIGSIIYRENKRRKKVE